MHGAIRDRQKAATSRLLRSRFKPRGHDSARPSATYLRHCQPSSFAALCFPGFGMGCVVREGKREVSNDLQQGAPGQKARVQPATAPK
jgi:hypothetical protein